jgi:peptidyl-tRNA hydrolase, PTH1 family
MHLLVGLGNPGADYQATRHNIGFMAADEIVRRYALSPWGKKFQGLVSTGMIGTEKVVVLKPMTFMNLSGQSVQAAMGFYKLPLSAVTIFHDDLDLPPGKVRIKQGGGAGGHNGLKSCDSHLGPDYWRIRLGIGHPGDKALVHNYVLGPFAKSDAIWLDPLIKDLANDLPLYLSGDSAGYLNKLSLCCPKG